MDSKEIQVDKNDFDIVALIKDAINKVGIQLSQKEQTKLQQR